MCLMAASPCMRSAQKSGTSDILVPFLPAEEAVTEKTSFLFLTIDLLLPTLDWREETLALL